MTGAAIGAGLGGVYGAVSNDTSVVGGMLGGAVAGAGLGRYGGAAALGAMRAGRSGATPGRIMSRGWGSMVGQMRGDYLGVTQRANKAINGFSGLGFRVGPGA